VPATIIVTCMSTPVDIADRFYARWNADGLSVLEDSVHPAIELVSDPLRPVESTLRGMTGWRQWVARWEDRYEDVHVNVDGLVPMDPEHVLAFVSITAKPTGAKDRPQHWATIHLWTLREGLMARWETHLDLALARRTLEA